jgi:serine/threonine-protein kinase RIO1
MSNQDYKLAKRLQKQFDTEDLTNFSFSPLPNNDELYESELEIDTECEYRNQHQYKEMISKHDLTVDAIRKGKSLETTSTISGLEDLCEQKISARIYNNLKDFEKHEYNHTYKKTNSKNKKILPEIFQEIYGHQDNITYGKGMKDEEIVFKCYSNKIESKREIRSLQLLTGIISVPKILKIQENYVFLEFLGNDGKLSPKLKDIHLDLPKLTVLYNQIMIMMKKMYQVGIIHGNLSEYNIIYHNEEPYFIDFTQEGDLKIDCERINHYFERKDVQTIDLFKFVNS